MVLIIVLNWLYNGNVLEHSVLFLSPVLNYTPWWCVRWTLVKTESKSRAVVGCFHPRGIYRTLLFQWSDLCSLQSWLLFPTELTFRKYHSVHPCLLLNWLVLALQRGDEPGGLSAWSTRSIPGFSGEPSRPFITDFTQVDNFKLVCSAIVLLSRA